MRKVFGILCVLLAAMFFIAALFNGTADASNGYVHGIAYLIVSHLPWLVMASLGYFFLKKRP